MSHDFGLAQLKYCKKYTTALEMGNRENFFFSDKDILLYIFGKVLVFSLESELIGKSIYLTSQKKSYLSLANFHSTGYDPTTPIECTT